MGKESCIACEGMYASCSIRDRVWGFLSIKSAVTATVNDPFYVRQCKILLAHHQVQL